MEIIIGFSSSFLNYLNTFNHLSLKWFVFVSVLQIIKFEFLKFGILEILNFHPCKHATCNLSAFLLVSVAELAGYCFTWLDILKTGFLAKRLNSWYLLFTYGPDCE